jgi:hypothetical protein
VASTGLAAFEWILIEGQPMLLLDQHGRPSGSFVLFAIGIFVALVGGGMTAPPERMPQSQSPTEHQLNAAERMRRRFPQPVRVGDLIGLRVLHDNDVTVGLVRHVACTTEGKSS